jgi:hypothetical protein
MSPIASFRSQGIRDAAAVRAQSSVRERAWCMRRTSTSLSRIGLVAPAMYAPSTCGGVRGAGSSAAIGVDTMGSGGSGMVKGHLLNTRPVRRGPRGKFRRTILVLAQAYDQGAAVDSERRDVAG